MLVKTVRVQNFRSILDAALTCEQLTGLVGANGAGKSSFLNAIELFYSDSPKLELDDFYNKDISKQIVISITFGDLQAKAKILFKLYLQNDELTIDRVFTWKDGKCESKLHGSLMQNPEFADFRAASEQGAAAARSKYEQLKANRQYCSWELSRPL